MTAEKKTGEEVADPERAGASDPESSSSKEENTAERAAAETAVETPAKFKTLVEHIEKMTVLELNELVKFLEKKFGVSAQAVAAPAAAGAGAGAAEEKAEFNVELTSAG